MNASMPPNILIFMTDQQNGSTVLPGSPVKTPVLDRFREEAVTFSQTYCPAPHCCPSRASFFTGLYPTEHGVWNNVCTQNALSRGLKPGTRLWSDYLKAAGYQLDWSGKWHVSDEEGPSNRGWTVHSITAEPGGKQMDMTWEKYRQAAEESGPQPHPPGFIRRDGYPPYVHYGTCDNPFNDEGQVESALQALRNRKASDGPWCQFVGTLGPHDPYFVPQEFLDLYDIDDIRLPDNFHDPMLDKPGLYRRTQDIFNRLTEEEHREALRHYYAFCSYEDALFGRLLEALEETGQADNTIVIYMSDHGDTMGEHGLWCKGLPCFDSTYHVPAIIRWPRRVHNPGRLVDAFVSLTDFGPTLLEAAGIEPAAPMSGSSLMPFLRDESPVDWRDALFTQSNGNELYGIQRSIRTKDWRFTYNGFDLDELYDMRADPGQLINLARDPAHAETARALMKRIWEFAHAYHDTCQHAYIMVGLADPGPAAVFPSGGR
jgi:choline-sulfatase